MLTSPQDRNHTARHATEACFSLVVLLFSNLAQSANLSSHAQIVPRRTLTMNALFGNGLAM